MTAAVAKRETQEELAWACIPLQFSMIYKDYCNYWSSKV